MTSEGMAYRARTKCIIDIRDRIKGLEDFQETNWKQFQEHKNETKEALGALTSKVAAMDLAHTAHAAAEEATSRSLWKAATIMGAVMTFGLGLLQLALWLYDRSGAL